MPTIRHLRRAQSTEYTILQVSKFKVTDLVSQYNGIMVTSNRLDSKLNFHRKTPDRLPVDADRLASFTVLQYQ